MAETDPLTETHLLDVIEDAELYLKRYRRFVRVTGMGWCISIALWGTGIGLGVWSAWHHVDAGLTAMGLIIIGIVFTLATTVIITIMHSGGEHEKFEPPAITLRNARRAHRDFLSNLETRPLIDPAGPHSSPDSPDPNHHN